jgi:hypothetical protein
MNTPDLDADEVIHALEAKLATVQTERDALATAVKTLREALSYYADSADAEHAARALSATAHLDEGE